MALSSGAWSSGGSMRMTGASTTSAPRRRRPPTSSASCSRGRVTMIRFPRSEPEFSRIGLLLPLGFRPDLVENLTPPFPQHLPRQALPELAWLLLGALNLAPQMPPSVRGADIGFQNQSAVEQGTDRSNRDLATSLQTVKQSALCFYLEGGLVMVEVGEILQDLRVIGASLQTERPLADCGQHLVGGNRGKDVLGHTQSDEPGAGENHRVPARLAELAKPGGDVASQFDDPEIGTSRQDLRTPPQAYRRQGTVARQGLKRTSLASDEHVARIESLGDRRQDQAGRQLGGEVFHAVDGEVHRPVQESALDLLDK